MAHAIIDVDKFQDLQSKSSWRSRRSSAIAPYVVEGLRNRRATDVVLVKPADLKPRKSQGFSESEGRKKKMQCPSLTAIGQKEFFHLIASTFCSIQVLH